MALQSCCIADGQRNAVFTMAGANAPHVITISFLNASRTSFMPVRILADSGSDITLLTRDTGESLGFYPNRTTNKFGVGGVGKGAVEFARFSTLVKVENHQPIQVNFGVSDKYAYEDGLRDNLLGRESVLDHYNITFSSSSVTFTPRAQRAATAMECGMCRRW